MRKKILGIAVMAVVAVAAAWNINQSENEIKLSDLALDNVEALASGEGGSGWWCCGYWGNCKSDGGSYIHGLFRVTPC
ncbi:NVEALA domain-containing protein [Parabacteroides distasonis]|uniref:NVEALA domain-containing protein n=1 Tax=Parabacteroides distasonis TaxID=823 RepID=UPI0021BD84A5|nr:NVEALA domain-containing protein [Parabacteroides distasonis]